MLAALLLKPAELKKKIVTLLLFHPFLVARGMERSGIVRKVGIKIIIIVRIRVRLDTLSFTVRKFKN